MPADATLAELARRPVLGRLLVVVACAGLAVLQQGSLRALQPALVLVLVALAASIGWPPMPRWVRLVAEGLAAASLAGALSADGTAYAAYTLVPVTVAGLETRPRRALLTVASTSAAYVVASAVDAPSGGLGRAVLSASGWAVTLFAFAFLAVTVRRVRTVPAGTDAHYLDAHRLLSELQGVSRQLSLGLDPRTLAAALREDLCALAGAQDGCVLVRTPAGRLVALAGQQPGDVDPGDVDEEHLRAAWTGGENVTLRADGSRVVWLPVLMDGEPVALAVLYGARPGERRTPAASGREQLMARLQQTADEAGPRLASALLFEEVRRLATVDERHRLAREIHDGIAQDLTSLAYLVDDVRADAEAPTAHRLDEVSARVRGLVNELRMRLFDLRAGVSDTVSLGGAVSQYLQQVSAQTGLAVRLTLDESPRRLPTSVEVEILRILQEAVTNVRRHAGAGRVAVELSVHPPLARLTVDDDGRGMQRARPDSLGITGMRERASRIGALLTIGPGPSAGTRVALVMDGASTRVPHPPGPAIRHDDQDSLTVPPGAAPPFEEETTA